MTRFLIFALPLLILAIALFNLGVELLGLDPDLGPLVGWREGQRGLPGAYVLGSWALEALGLTALYLLVAQPGRPRWLSGLLSGWIAWVFRGPLLVLAAVAIAGQAGGPWWRLSLRWLVLYTLAGLLLAAVARFTRVDAADAVPAGPGSEPPVQPPPRDPEAGRSTATSADTAPPETAPLETSPPHTAPPDAAPPDTAPSPAPPEKPTPAAPDPTPDQRQTP